MSLAVFSVIGVSSALEAVGYFIVTMVVWFVVYYIFALPLMVFLMLFANWGLFGFWVPYTVGALAEFAPPLLFLLFCINWRRVIARQPSEKEAPSREGSGCSDRTLGVVATPEDTESEESSATPAVLGHLKTPVERPMFRPLLCLLPALLCAGMLTVFALALRIYRPQLLDFTSASNITHILNDSSYITTGTPSFWTTT